LSWLDLGSRLDDLGHVDAWAILLVVGLLAFLENAALVGLVVPGEAAVLVGGALAQRGAVDVVPLWVVVFIGAVAGDSVGYTIGKRLMPWLATTRAVRFVGAERLQAATHYMHRRGPKAVFFGRFVALVRTLVPLLAGASRMSYRRFLTWNAAGAFIWSLAHVAAGYAAGASWRRLESTLSGVGLIVALVVGVVVVKQLRGDRLSRRTCLHCATEDVAA
jgi:membrane protein DedA with SNARE-associated domain